MSGSVDELYQRTQSDKARRVVLLVRDDEVLQRLLLAWDLVERSSEENWEECGFSYNEWCELAGIPTSTGNLKRCERAIQYGMVLPDGRLHYWVDRFLEESASALVSRGREEET